ncbi:TPA: type II toxin-antitoxin system HicA family toxin [Enterobacter asburiae]|jgi:predicted RNA binding protein YcfA (HicA-like mRNA interferase family)
MQSITKEVRSMSSDDLIRRIQLEGWNKVAQKGSHVQFKHPTKKGRVTIPHPEKDLPKGTVKSILKQAGLAE